MEKEFLKYTEALALKELGFNEMCFSTFIYKVPELQWELNFVISDNRHIGTVASPTFSQAFRFFREKYNIIPNIHSIYTDETHTKIEFWFWFGNYEDDSDDEVFYGTYEEAELECLKKLIEIVKEKKNETE